LTLRPHKRFHKQIFNFVYFFKILKFSQGPFSFRVYLILFYLYLKYRSLLYFDYKVYLPRFYCPTLPRALQGSSLPLYFNVCTPPKLRSTILTRGKPLLPLFQTPFKRIPILFQIQFKAIIGLILQH